MVRTLARRIRGTIRQSGMKSDFTWRYGLNLRHVLPYHFGRHPLRGEASRIVEDLNRDGIARTSADLLFPHDGSCYDEMIAMADQLQNSLAEQCAATRAAANDPSANGSKPYLLHLLGEHPTLNPNDVWARFALQEPIVHIVNAYFGMFVRLCHYNIWHNFPTAIPARESQLWHRDPEDRHILKVFVYLTDIDDSNGPFTYAPGTHPKGSVREQPDNLYKQNQTTRSDDRQMAEVVPGERWFDGSGPKGSIVFADTRGFHKGGLALRRDRIMYICEFLSPGSGHSGISTRTVNPGAKGLNGQAQHPGSEAG